jgi:hypothetical protein
MAGHSPTQLRLRLPWLANLAVHASVSLGGLFAVASWATATEPLANYTDTLKPLLAERCYSCHGGLKQEAGLRLDTVSLMRQGGESGAAIAPWATKKEVPRTAGIALTSCHNCFFIVISSSHLNH